MATCEVCGNQSDEVIEVTAAGVTHAVDSFQCAMQLMAPVWTGAGAGRWVARSCPMTRPAALAPPSATPGTRRDRG